MHRMTATQYNEFTDTARSEYYSLIKIVKALVKELDKDVWFLETAKNEGICIKSIMQIIDFAESQAWNK